jgi:hypothetical protein
LERAGVAISMEGRGRTLDNIFVDRLWRKVKDEDIYLNDYASVPALDAGLERDFTSTTVNGLIKAWPIVRQRRSIGNSTDVTPTIHLIVTLLWS